MAAVSTPPQQKPWQVRRRRASVLAEMALRQEKVSARLADLREQAGLTQEQAAARVGVNLRQWQRWEAGDSMPYPRNLDTIASRFGISVDEFFDTQQTQLDRIEERLARIEAALELLTATNGKRRAKRATDKAVARSRQRRATTPADPPAQTGEGHA